MGNEHEASSYSLKRVVEVATIVKAAIEHQLETTDIDFGAIAKILLFDDSFWSSSEPGFRSRLIELPIAGLRACIPVFLSYCFHQGEEIQTIQIYSIAREEDD